VTLGAQSPSAELMVVARLGHHLHECITTVCIV
jgi:hypothetical protein